jgi:hypothetical protein
MNKSPLDLNLYERFNIDQNYSAFKITFDDLDQDEVDNIEAEYVQKGYKIFHTEMESNGNGTFKYSLIIAKLEFTF